MYELKIVIRKGKDEPYCSVKKYEDCIKKSDIKDGIYHEMYKYFDSLSDCLRYLYKIKM